ncbi:hypothetical protein ACFJGW_05150 [Burkholderiaceae bacterium UC74_6]
MKHFQRALLSAALLAALPLLAQAQAQQSPEPEATPQPRVVVRTDKIEMDSRRIAMDAERASRDAERAGHDAERAAREAAEVADIDIRFVGQEMGRGRVVKGAPYCADAVHETVQPLADGNRIVRAQVDKLCRDGEGRTRQEVERGGKKIVYLRDPVSKESWVLDTEAKTARKAGGMAWVTQDDGQWKVFGAQMREMATKMREQFRGEGAPPAPAVPPAPPAAPKAPLPPEPVVLTENIKGCEGKDAPKDPKDGKTKVKCEVRVQVVRMEPGKVAPLAPLPALQAPPAVLARNVVFAPRGDGSTTSLPPKEIEGVKVNGERTSWTIEAGKIGNEKPIVITSDVWTSPELMVTVSSRDFDPRSGETNYRLQNIKRSEPDAALMKLPADYKKLEAPHQEMRDVRIIRERATKDAPKAASKP